MHSKFFVSGFQFTDSGIDKNGEELNDVPSGFIVEPGQFKNLGSAIEFIGEMKGNSSLNNIFFALKFNPQLKPIFKDLLQIPAPEVLIKINSPKLVFDLFNLWGDQLKKIGMDFVFFDECSLKEEYVVKFLSPAIRGLETSGIMTSIDPIFTKNLDDELGLMTRLIKSKLTSVNINTYFRTNIFPAKTRDEFETNLQLIIRQIRQKCLFNGPISIEIFEGSIVEHFERNGPLFYDFDFVVCKSPEIYKDLLGQFEDQFKAQKYRTVNLNEKIQRIYLIFNRVNPKPSSPSEVVDQIRLEENNQLLSEIQKKIGQFFPKT